MSYLLEQGTQIFPDAMTAKDKAFKMDWPGCGGKVGLRTKSWQRGGGCGMGKEGRPAKRKIRSVAVWSDGGLDLALVSASMRMKLDASLLPLRPTCCFFAPSASTFNANLTNPHRRLWMSWRYVIFFLVGPHRRLRCSCIATFAVVARLTAEEIYSQNSVGFQL